MFSGGTALTGLKLINALTYNLIKIPESTFVTTKGYVVKDSSAFKKNKRGAKLIFPCQKSTILIVMY